MRTKLFSPTLLTATSIATLMGPAQSHAGKNFLIQNTVVPVRVVSAWIEPTPFDQKLLNAKIKFKAEFANSCEAPARQQQLAHVIIGNDGFIKVSVSQVVHTKVNCPQIYAPVTISGELPAQLLSKEEAQNVYVNDVKANVQ